MPGKLGNKFVCALGICCGLAASSFVAAEESPVYESLANVEIGRIFLSPAQRSSLDKRRGSAPPAVSRDAKGTRAAAKSSPDAAGYILRSGGPSRVWSSGGFVPADDVSGVAFPGDVKVVRGAARTRGADRGAADDGS